MGQKGKERTFLKILEKVFKVSKEADTFSLDFRETFNMKRDEANGVNSATMSENPKVFCAGQPYLVS